MGTITNICFLPEGPRSIFTISMKSSLTAWLTICADSLMLKNQTGTLNRAVSRFMWGLYWLDSLRDGVKYTRDATYHAKSCAKMLEKWRLLSAGSDSFAKRGLLSKRLSADQKALLSLQSCERAADVLTLMHQCKHWFFANVDAINRLDEAKSPAELRKLVSYVKKDRAITPRIRAMILKNADTLLRLSS